MTNGTCLICVLVLELKCMVLGLLSMAPVLAVSYLDFSGPSGVWCRVGAGGCKYEEAIVPRNTLAPSVSAIHKDCILHLPEQLWVWRF